MNSIALWIVSMFATTLATDPALLLEYAKSIEPVAQQEETCYKHTAGEDQNQFVRYASAISDDDVVFLAMIDAENGLWTPDRQSEVYHNGYREQSYGFCQINKKYHPEIVNDPRFWGDPKWQLEKCYELYINGTSFSGMSKVDKTKQNFICP